MQSWVRSGDFYFGSKLYHAIKDNVIYYAVLGVLGVVFLVYMLVAVKFRKEDLMTFLMAAANAWGLLLSTVMLGYGLVEIPRSLWYSSSTRWSLRYLELQAPKAKEAVVDSEAEIYEIARDLATISKKMEASDPLRKHVDFLLEKCPLALDERAADDADSRDQPVNIDRLKDVHARIKYAVGVHRRNEAIFRSSMLNVTKDNYEITKLRILWWWYIYIKPISIKTISILCIIASLVIVWSESTFQVTSVPLSIPRFMLKSDYISVATLEIVSMSFLLYICTCAYSTLFKIKIFDYYVIVPEHNTDEPSLLFVGAYLCRLTFPLCYNFLNMVGDDENSVFVKYQGKAADLTPLLGDGFNTWVPLLVLIFAIITLLNLYGRILSLFKVKNYFYEEVAKNESEDVDQGRQVISQARVAEERRLARGQLEGSYGLNAMDSSGRRVARATNTRELLAKYNERANFASTSKAQQASGGSSSSASSSSANQQPPNSSSSSIKSAWMGGSKTKAAPQSTPVPPKSPAVGRYQKLEEPSGGSDASSRVSNRKFGTASPAPSTQDPINRTKSPGTGRVFGVDYSQESLLSSSPSGSGAAKPQTGGVSNPAANKQRKNIFDLSVVSNVFWSTFGQPQHIYGGIMARNEEESSGDEAAEVVVDKEARNIALAEKGRVDRMANQTTHHDLQEVDAKVKGFVRLALAMEHRRMPIKRDDLTKKVLGQHARAYAAIFDRAQSILKQLFGMEMVLLPVKSRKPAAGEAVPAGDNTANSKQYALRSTLANEERTGVSWGPETPSMGLLCVILTLIHCSGRSLSDDSLMAYLGRLRIRMGDNHHHQLGSISQLFDSFVKHGYLEKAKRVGDESQGFDYRWGPRAYIEFPVDNIHLFVSEIFPDVRVEQLSLLIERAAM
ncbi:LMBR1 domain-containing protein 2 [Chytridiales sp. JEL 0842]|nr:LMBR1 domain-containing protein 2 [Chytridiales sp. JEL 0842]